MEKRYYKCDCDQKKDAFDGVTAAAFDENMKLRRYRPSDCKEILEMFCRTVHTVNAEDYTQEQLDAWTGHPDPDRWNRSLMEHDTIVAETCGSIIGFGDMDRSGYLDRLYVHSDYQGCGIATAICDRLEKTVPGTITVHASVTAKPFFEKRGYRVIREQQVERLGVWLKNYIMEKRQEIVK